MAPCCQAPDNEYIPVADGVFSFDGASKFWMSFWLNQAPHINADVTFTADIATGATQRFYSGLETGYLEATVATPSGKTWGIMKKLARKDTKLILTLSSVELAVPWPPPPPPPPSHTHTPPSPSL